MNAKRMERTGYAVEIRFDMPGILRAFVGPKELRRLLMSGREGDGFETIRERLGDPPLFKSVKFRGKLLAEMFMLWPPDEDGHHSSHIVIIRANCGLHHPPPIDPIGYEVTRERIFLLAWNRHVLRHVKLWDPDGKPKLGIHGIYAKLDDVYDDDDDEFCHALIQEAKVVMKSMGLG